MTVPCMNKSLHSNLADLASKIGHTVPHQPILHVQRLLVNHLDECTLDWEIDPLIYFRPHSLNSVVLWIKRTMYTM